MDVRNHYANHESYSECNSTPVFDDFLDFSLNSAFSIPLVIAKLIFRYSLYVLVVAVLVLVLKLLYRAYWRPEHYIRELIQEGFDHIPPGPHREARIARAQSSRNIGTKLPPPYPNGWFAVAETSSLKIGSVIAVDALGQNLCVYRGEDGIARCIDAYCPHLGAHFATGGNVCGNCIECPFHGWRFDASGALVSVPGVDTVPKGVSIKTWKVVEAVGAVWIWYDAEGREPLWDIPEAPKEENWTLRGTNELFINSHLQDVAENAADMAHLNVVHTMSVLFTRIMDKFPTLKNNIGHHSWAGEFKLGEGQTATTKIIHDYKFMNMSMVRAVLNITVINPGLVQVLMDTSFGPIFHCHSITPISPLRLKLVQRVFSPSRNAVWGYLVQKGTVHVVKQDISIWNSKRFVSAPVYVRSDSDKSIRTFRTWYSQFYSEHSISFKDAQQNTLDW